MSKVVTALLPLLLVPSALAASVTASVPISTLTQPACQFDTAAGAPTLTLPDYEAALASTYTGEQAQVSVSVYCNKGTTLTNRTLGGSALATSQASALTVPLALNGAAGQPTLDALVWSTVGPSDTMSGGAFQGAARYVSVVRAGWPQTPQFNAPNGPYSGTVDFTVEF